MFLTHTGDLADRRAGQHELGCFVKCQLASLCIKRRVLRHSTKQESEVTVARVRL